MRKINRNAEPTPNSLRAAALREERLALEEYYARPKAERERRRPPFNEQVLERDDVVRALDNLFKRRCAYCEDQVTSTDGNVSHFRPARGAEVPPLGRARQLRFSSDHYGWFAYEWRNLLVVCPQCRKYQSNTFLAIGALAPLLCTWSEANVIEDVQLLDPCIDDPLKHLSIAISGEMTGRTSKGRLTLELFHLNRSELVEQRKRRVDEVVSVVQSIASGRRMTAEALQADLFSSQTRAGAKLLTLRGILDCVAELPGFNKRMAGARSIEGALQAIASVPLEVLQGALNDYVHSVPIGRGPAAALPAPRDETVWGQARTGAGRVRSVVIKNFKGISGLSLDFMKSGETTFSSPCTVLLGENAVGKSSVLQALCLTLASSTERRSLKTNVEDFLSRDPNQWRILDGSPEVVVTLDDGQMVRLETKADSSAFSGPGSDAVLLLAYGARRYFETNKRTKAVENKTLFDPLATIPDATRWLQESSESDFNGVARAMAEVLALQPGDHIYRGDDGNVWVHAHGRSTPISRMSDGYKSLFAMAVDIMCRMVQRWGNLEAARGLVLIDEIETHLHPRWKLQVMTALRAALPQVQFIVTTHDPLCLRGMGDNEVIVLSRDSDGNVRELEGLPSAMGLRAEQLLTSDYFGLSSTTDPAMDRLLNQYIETVQGTALPTEANSQLREKILQQISSISVRGDTVSQQLVSEAIARYLAVKRAQPLLDNEPVREDAIEAILAVLNRRDNDAIRR